MYITPFTTSRMMTRRLPPPRLPGGMSGSTSVHSRRSDRLDNAARRDCSGGDFRSSTCGTSKTNRCHTRNHKRFPPFKSSLRLTQGNRTWKSPDLRRGACAIRARSILGPACRNPPEDMLDQFVACFEGLEDPRTGNAGLHDFHELLVIALCTVLSGGQGATHMEAFAVAKESFLRGFLRLEHGLPSHDTFSRLFRLLDPSSSAP